MNDPFNAEYYESDHYKKVKAYLKSQRIDEQFYKTRKAAILSSISPFGFLAAFKDKNGDEYYFVNGRLTNMKFYKTEE